MYNVDSYKLCLILHMYIHMTLCTFFSCCFVLIRFYVLYVYIQWIIPKKQVSISTNRGIVPIYVTYSVKIRFLKNLSVHNHFVLLLVKDNIMSVFPWRIMHVILNCINIDLWWKRLRFFEYILWFTSDSDFHILSHKNYFFLNI